MSDPITLSNWQEHRKMTGKQYEAITKRLGLSQAGAGRYVGVSERTSRRFITGEAEIPVAVALLLRALVHFKEAPLVPKWVRNRY